MGKSAYFTLYPDRQAPAGRERSFDALGAATRPGGGTMKVEARTEIADDLGRLVATVPRLGFLGRLAVGSRLVGFRGR